MHVMVCSTSIARLLSTTASSSLLSAAWLLNDVTPHVWLLNDSRLYMHVLKVWNVVVCLFSAPVCDMISRCCSGWRHRCFNDYRQGRCQQAVLANNARACDCRHYFWCAGSLWRNTWLRATLNLQVWQMSFAFVADTQAKSLANFNVTYIVCCCKRRIYI